MKRSFYVRTLLVGVLAFLMASIPVQGQAEAASGRPPAEVSAAAGAGAASTNAPRDTTSIDDNYAQREARSPRTADFEGGEGNGLYIGGSALTVVLLILLVVILL